MHLEALGTNLGGYGRSGDNNERSWECRQQAWVDLKLLKSSQGEMTSSLAVLLEHQEIIVTTYC